MPKIIAIAILICYAILLVYGLIAFLSEKNFIPKAVDRAKTKTCVIITARNEEQYIEKGIRSLLEQDFNRERLEVIIVDDASTDATRFIVENALRNSGLNYKILSNEKQEGKKRSITKAVEISQSELIITRDADTYTVSNKWLSTIVAFYEERSMQFIIAPVELENSPGLLSQLQRFENLALIPITGGYALWKKPFLCNGANLAFTKRLFAELGGYKNHEKVASGDDILFLEEVRKKRPETISYLKNGDAVVITYPVKGITQLISQKLRWIQKSNHNPNLLNTLMGLTVLLVHLFSLFFVFRLIFVYHIALLGIIFISGRVFIDFLLLFLSTSYFIRPVKWLWFLPLALIYSVYVIIITVLSLFIKPNWK
jgi:cellulose synthase/poly-beta-1,6-N-acetylglucosamine synthase-like glycosyltransferase